MTRSSFSSLGEENFWYIEGFRDLQVKKHENVIYTSQVSKNFQVKWKTSTLYSKEEMTRVDTGLVTVKKRN